MDAGLAADIASIGLQSALNNGQQGGFARAVVAHQANAFAFIELQADFVEQDLVADGKFELVGGQ